ncbi:MAG: chloride channel protein [Deltaproteobacteria bacterium]|nr:chloride channel protein [Deltaproteobacteria bacterium]
MRGAGGKSGAAREGGEAGRLAVPIAALIVGLIGGLASASVLYLVELSRRAFAILDGWSGPVAVLAVLAIPALGGLAVGRLEGRPSARQRAHGAAEFIHSELPERSTRGSTIARVLANLLTVTTGGSAGCEGAVGQLGSRLGTALGRHLALPRYRVHVLAACGLAAALGGLLQAPIAGCVFAGEIVLGGYAVRSILPLGISAFSSALVARHLFGGRPAFPVPEFVLVSPIEMGGYLVVGIASGATALAFMVMLEQSGRVHDRLGVPDWIKPVLGGAVIGGIGLFWPTVRGVGYSTIGSLLSEHLPIAAVAVLLIAKLAATSMTLGSGGAGGMFAPSLFAGASVGSMIGEAAQRWWPGTVEGRHSYAIVGMAAVVAGTTRAPLTAILIAAELTGNYLVVFPATLAVVASVFVSSAMRDDTVPVLRLARRGIDAMAGRRSGVLHEQTVAELMLPTQDVIAPDLAMAEVLRYLRVCRDDILVVEDPQQAGRVVGVVNLDNVKALMGDRADAQGVARDVMMDAPMLSERDVLAQAVAAFTRCHLPALPVVNGSGRVVGVVTRYEVMDLCARELLRGYLGMDPDGQLAEQAEPANELTPLLHEVCAVPVPRPFAGHTLREIDLVRRWGVTCVGLRRANEGGALTPLPLDTAQPLLAGDVMILIGDKASVERVRLLDRASDRPPGRSEA